MFEVDLVTWCWSWATHTNFYVVISELDPAVGAIP